MDENGQLKKVDALIPFGIGRRLIHSFCFELYLTVFLNELVFYIFDAGRIITKALMLFF